MLRNCRELLALNILSSCHAWTALPTGIADKTAIGSFVRESHERTEEQRTLVPQNPDKDDYRTPWREAIYPFWNHVFADVMRWLPQVNCSVGHFHAPAHGVLALGYPSNGDGEGEVKSVRKIWDTNVLLIPAWLDEGVEVRMLSREGEGETTLGTFSAVDTALIWYLKRGTEVEFFIDEAWERERKIAAVLVFGVLCTEGHGEGDADEKDRGDKMNTTDE